MIPEESTLFTWLLVPFIEEPLDDAIESVEEAEEVADIEAEELVVFSK